MNIVTIIRQFNERQEITVPDLAWLTANKQEVYSYLLLHFQHDFAIAVLNTLTNQRKAQQYGPGIEDIMFGCLLVALHRQVEDCLIIWKAKNVDFDAYCGLDIQLVAFMGVAATISFLQTSNDPDASKALAFLLECEEAGEFEELDGYYSGIYNCWWMS
ncbi:hypothetical protein SAMN05660909_02862 [Chitinophaga terrae (ex Kim and Jung 2007)]|jgi:hypothetical protein|uniref:Uncharacterized protein n=1 Tax=Chitinophaga terrae (ex Kim and Jung 2007) TaxID=408074 RepID=A0A1H4CZG1_9BACT|nr:hypothetical protein [Chitinophaga terrae (ex Kim and Jung 2007)]GEP90651.1 hypothetical protein CTE07_22960 [Chitinophaga terrae (ex Kim and Jung 2007)]SEA65893.1 hypothetical protein SAMN05660909_02862 [Chitinophaga terrae (ex Kim and Jung 2007)]